MDTKALRQKILDLAIRGKLVPQDPNDEPASVLLERIRAEKQQMVKDGKLKAKDIKNDTVIFLGDDNLHYEKIPDGAVKCIEDEIPFDLPDGWEWCRISEVIELYSGQDLTPDRYNDTGKGIPYITGASNLSDGSVIVNRWTDSPTVHSKSGDLLLTCKGSGVGKMAFSDIEDAHIARQIMALRCKPSIDRYYLQIVVSAIINDITAQANGIIPGIRREIVLASIIPLPPYNEQKKIAEHVQSALSLLKNIETDKDDLKSTIQLTKSKILDLAIRGKLVPQNPDDEPASVLLDRIRAEKEELIKQGKIKRDKKESVIYKGDDNSYYEKIGDTVTCIDEELPFELPDGWAWIRLSSACIINPKNNIDDDTVVSFVPMTLIQDGYANEFTFEQRKWGEVKKGFTHFAENDVGFAKITPCFENRKSVVFRGLCNGYGAGTTELYILRTFPDTIMPEYILYIVKTESFLVGGKQTCAGVVGQQRISKDYVCDYLVPVPPLNEQVRIINKCTEIMTMLHNIEKSLS